MKEFKSHANFDKKIRNKKAQRILKILTKNKSYLNQPLLDIGTGSGINAQVFSKYFNVTSIDVIDERTVKKGYKFKLVKDTTLPFKENSFNVIVSNQVIEHINDAEEHLREIFRCLKKGGICYLATPNKWAIFEAHYKLPFLSWFSLRISDFYLYLIKKQKYDVRPLSFQQIIRLAKKQGFYMKHLTITILRNPKYFSLENQYNLYSKIIKFIPRSFDVIIRLILPSWIFILKKK